MRQHATMVSLATALGVALLVPTACGSGTTDPVTTAAEEPRPRVVARTDVTGDGSRDRVTYRVLPGDRVRIGVRSGATTATRRVLDTELWPGRGGYWHGAARLDGRPGTELFIGTTMGAHTPLFTVLTMRAGRLRVQASPLPGGPEWWVDAFVNGYSGWTRTNRDGRVRVVSRTVYRDGGGSRAHLWTGQARAFVWSNDRWVSDGGRDLAVRGDRKAARVGGFHVPGLPRWPSG